ncbi:MAG: hypothetical protein KDD14_19600 [Saprospiraceae bacterium]|nr:hypothetical protein [Saprospiraceae bacterium]
MSVTLAIPPTIEQQLRDDAARQGVSLEQYITQVLMSGLSGSNQPDADELSEDELLQRVQLNVQPKELEEYDRLVERRKAEQLSNAEYEKLLILTNRIEIAHAERMKYVVALAKLRGVSLEQIMLDLGIQKNTP